MNLPITQPDMMESINSSNSHGRFSDITLYQMECRLASIDQLAAVFCKLNHLLRLKSHPLIIPLRNGTEMRQFHGKEKTIGSRVNLPFLPWILRMAKAVLF